MKKYINEVKITNLKKLLILEEKIKEKVRRYRELCNFSKPSLATGKSWNEIQSELRAVA